mmetsp:Transcript_26573/g.44426  ORF Transcript_26573/g.44426 Transcript_26573/m.44426 type:complete len:555 (-) Transcript_26573:79-1743(-)
MDERISIAPMMEWTDPHYRRLLRYITKRTVLYTEMVVDDTIIHSPNLDFFLGRDIEEGPSVIQLGGHDAEKLAQATEICGQYGGKYEEINLNCGCPSQRVSQRCFGAKLMLEPEHVRELVSSMQRRVPHIPITVKCRIGADDMDTYAHLTKFITCASAGGAKKFIVHARKCHLKGLNPKQNRDVPPLRYEVVHRLVQDFPELKFILNGGIQSFSAAHQHLDTSNGYLHDPATFEEINNGRTRGIDNTSKKRTLDDTCVNTRTTTGTSTNSSSCLSKFTGSLNTGREEVLPAVHGVMIGRTAYSNPMSFATADSEFFGVADPCLSRREVLAGYIDYCEWCQSEQGPQFHTKKTAASTAGRPKRVTTSILLNAMRNIMHGLPNQQKFRVALNDLYMAKLRCLKSSSGGGGGGADPDRLQPNIRDIIEEACQVLSDEDLDRPLGRTREQVQEAEDAGGSSYTTTTATATIDSIYTDKSGKGAAGTGASKSTEMNYTPPLSPPPPPDSSSSSSSSSSASPSASAPSSALDRRVPAADRVGEISWRRRISADKTCNAAE